MALDNAEFIAELSVVDPPGTDPLNQGDDHIRTTKKAVQQSFPNVGSAVPQTGVQMAQMAIKNEVNTFTVAQQFNNNITVDGQIKAGAGLAGAPGVSFFGDQDTGMFLGAVGLLGFAVGGADLFNLQSSRATFGTLVRGQDGSVTTPAYSFVSETGTGMLRDTAGRLSFAVSGGLVFLMESARIQSQVQHRFADSVAATPAISFATDPATGMFLGAVGSINWAIAGVGTMQLLSNSLRMSAAGMQILAQDGTAAFPGYGFLSDPGTGITATPTSCDISANGVSIASFTSTSDIFAGIGRSWSGQTARTAARPAFNFSSDSDTGMYNGAPNTINFAVGGVSWGTFDSAAMWTANGVSVHGDGASSVTNPAYAFTNDVATGLYRVGAAKLGWAVGGVQAMTLEGGTVSTQLTINQTAGTGAIHTFLQNGVLRWQSGGVGTNQESWSVTRFSDAGAFLNTLFDINRATGNIRMPALPTTNPGGSGRLWKSGGFVAIT